MNWFLGLWCALTVVSVAVASEVPERALCVVCVVGGETEFEKVEAVREYQGKPVYFCSDKCAKEFDIDPAAYIFQPGPAPKVAGLPALAGNETLTLNAKAGGALLIDFWATWCKPCVKSMPEIDAFYQEYRARGLQVVGVSVDTGKDREKKVRKFLDKNPVSYPMAVDREESAAWEAYGVKVLPTLFLVDGDGTIVKRWTGVVDMDDVRRSLDELLASPSGDERG
jgi:thiol-disulfide isomerase/thioredoxin